jgi:uncharacterized membrane protein YsdA (DUF1294 family)
MPWWVFWPVVGMNAFAFFLFGFDKWRAGRGGRRVRESTLLLVTWLCGCVGAEIGARVFRHKTKKASYRWRALLVTVANPLWWLVWIYWL